MGNTAAGEAGGKHRSSTCESLPLSLEQATEPQALAFLHNDV